MSPLPWVKLPGLSLAAALIVLSLPSSGAASISRSDALIGSIASAAKYCSAAFRYAARTGNDDIDPLSPVQIFANDWHRARSRYPGTSVGFETVAARLRSATAMCGAV